MFSTVKLCDTVTLEPNHEYFLRGKTENNSMFDRHDLIFMPFKDKLAERYLAATTSLVTLNENYIPLRLINLKETPVMLYKGTTVGIVERVNQDNTFVEDFRQIQNKETNENNKPHMKKLCDDLLGSGDLNHDEKCKAIKLVGSYSDIFSSSSLDLGCCKKAKHDIFTHSNYPIHEPIRRVPMGLEENVDKLVNDLLEKGIIRNSESPWNAPIVVVKKKSGEIRLCIDYRKLNAVTKRPIFPIPETFQLFETLQGSEYFSSIDLSNAYYQVEVNEADKEKTAFATRRGQFEFNRMPFGLSGAPSTFQRMMSIILRAENWRQCIIYLDDVLIFAKNFDQHIDRLQNVFQRLREAGIKLSPNKCSLFQTELKFLGHIITKNGIQTDPNKIVAVQNWKRPESVTEMRSFLGFCNYYRKFIKDYAELVSPLESLLKNEDLNNKKKEPNRKLRWTTIETSVFIKLKSALTEAPVLAFPDPKSEFILDTDASHEAMGAVLSQVQNGEERVIAYASKKFSKCEMNYCVTRKELLAVYTFVIQYRHYLLGRKFRIRTDHKSLTWMLNWEKPNSSQYCSWIAELEVYDFRIEHRAGKDHVNADCLSRLPQCQQCDLCHEEPKKKRNTKLLHADKIRTIEDISLDSMQHKCEIISKFHDGLGHLGVEKTHDMLKEKFRWGNMYNDVKTFVANCKYCAERKHKGNVKQRPANHITATKLFEKIMIDIAGPLKPVSRFGYRYILSIVDVFSRYIMIVPMRDTSSKSIIQVLLQRWMSVFGSPQSIISDNATNFTSNEIKDFCKSWGIEKRECSPYYPQGNGIVERSFRTIKDMLYATSMKNKQDWSLSIPYVEMGLRSSKSKTTGHTPNDIIFGKNVVEPFRTHLKASNPEKDRDVILDPLNKPAYKIGDHVMVKNISSPGLMKRRYFGPCTVIEVLSSSSYRLNYHGKEFIRNDFHLKRLGNVINWLAQSSMSGSSPISWRQQKVQVCPYTPRVEEQLLAPAARNPSEPRSIHNTSHMEEQLLDSGTHRYPQRQRPNVKRLGFL